MELIFKDPTFSSLLLRTISETYYKGADIGECISTAYRIKEGDFDSWYEEWSKTAKRIHSYAEECISKGHIISARDAYLRASNYYRTAEFLLVEPNDPRAHTTMDLSKECFRRALPSFPFMVESLDIPYEGTTIPGYFYHVSKKNNKYSNVMEEIAETNNTNNTNNNTDNTSKKNSDKNDIFKHVATQKSSHPTLVVHGGFDSTLEELYTFAAAPALERGYNCLTFEGPGQGNVILKQGITFRHDWEKVITPVLDFMLSKKRFNIDSKRIALMGISMGGYLAARAAAFEPRLSAVILYDGVYDGYDAIKSGLPPRLLSALDEGNSEFVNTVISELMNSDPNVKFNMKHGMWTTGSNSPFELIIGAKKFSVKNILGNIKIPTLVLEGEMDDSFPGQPEKVYDGLICLPPSLKKHIVFTKEEGAEEHCQNGAPAITNQRIFDWLDEIFDNHIQAI